MPIPYANRVSKIDGHYSICPEPGCGAEIRLRERKDFESYTGAEYERHFRVEHTEKYFAMNPGKR
jgi:hypothetical protein